MCQVVKGKKKSETCRMGSAEGGWVALLNLVGRDHLTEQVILERT